MGSSFASRYGRVAIVAGASEGLGVAFAESLARRGLNLLLLARRGERLEEVAARLRSAHRVDVRAAVCDLASPELPRALEELTADQEIGVAVYNAAFAPVGEIAERPLDELLRVVDVNVRGPLIFVRTLAPRMIQRGRGAFVLMSSLAGFHGTPRIATYAATKAFNTVLGEGLWHELRPSGVDVVVSCAGAIRTPGFARTSGVEAPGTLDSADVAEQSLDALGHGPTIVPGATNRVARFVLGHVLPRRMAISMMARSTKGLV